MLDFLRYINLFTSVLAVIVFMSIVYSLVKSRFVDGTGRTRRMLIVLNTTLAMSSLILVILYVLILFFELSVAEKNFLANVRILVTNFALIFVGLTIKQIQAS